MYPGQVLSIRVTHSRINSHIPVDCSTFTLCFLPVASPYIFHSVNHMIFLPALLLNSFHSMWPLPWLDLKLLLFSASDYDIYTSQAEDTMDVKRWTRYLKAMSSVFKHESGWHWTSQGIKRADRSLVLSSNSVVALVKNFIGTRSWSFVTSRNKVSFLRTDDCCHPSLRIH
jgi:hypothetical protein